MKIMVGYLSTLGTRCKNARRTFWYQVWQHRSNIPWVQLDYVPTFFGKTQKTQNSQTVPNARKTTEMHCNEFPWVPESLKINWNLILALTRVLPMTQHGQHFNDSLQKVLWLWCEFVFHVIYITQLFTNPKTDGCLRPKAEYPCPEPRRRRCLGEINPWVPSGDP